MCTFVKTELPQSILWEGWYVEPIILDETNLNDCIHVHAYKGSYEYSVHWEGMSLV